MQFFRASWAQNLRDPDAGRLLFSDLNAMLTRSTFNDIVQHAQRTMAECTQFLCAGRAEFPEILQIFRSIFAQTLRDLDAGRLIFSDLNAMLTRSTPNDYSGRWVELQKVISSEGSFLKKVH